MPYYNRQRGTWTAQVVHREKRYRSQHGSRAAAEQWEIMKKRELEEQESGSPLTPTLSLLDFVNMYLNYSRTRHSSKTYDEKRSTFRFLFRTVDPDISISRLHKGLVLAHLSSQAQIRSGYSANKDRKNLIAAWNWGVRYLPGFPEDNPFLVDKFPELRTPRYVPPEQDFWKVYRMAESEQDRLMLLCYLHLAARRNEIFNLRVEDVDLQNRRIRLYTRKRKDGSLHYDWLPMTDRLAGEMSDFLAFVSRNWVFPDPKTGLPYIARQRWLARLCRKAGVKKFGLHGIRHLSASILIRNNVSLLDVQTILRHKNMTTTQQYIHRLESVRQAINTFK